MAESYSYMLDRHGCFHPLGKMGEKCILPADPTRKYNVSIKTDKPVKFIVAKIQAELMKKYDDYVFTFYSIYTAWAINYLDMVWFHIYIYQTLDGDHLIDFHYMGGNCMYMDEFHKKVGAHFGAR